MQYYLFLSLALILFAILLPVVIYVWRQDNTPSWTPAQSELRWLLVVTLLYLILNSCEILMRDERSIVFFASLCYLCSTTAPTWWFLFALDYCGYQSLSKRLSPLLWLVPAVAIGVIFTNPFHHWHWKAWEFIQVGSFTAMRATSYGPGFWLLYAWLQFLVFSATILVCSSLFRRTLALSRQSLLVLVACLIPILFNACYVFRLIPHQIKDFSPIAYGLSAILFTVGVYYNRLFDLVPIARRALVDSLSDPLVAVDFDGRIIDANPAAVELFCLPPDPVGSKLSGNRLLRHCAEALASSSDGVAEVSPDDRSWYEARQTRVFAGKRILQLYSLRDVTERKLLVEKLSRALEDIQSLEGIIPICSSCKKIRDDSGYWQQVESYLSRHTSAEFTHGLCPDCQRVLYENMIDMPGHVKGDGDDSAPERDAT